MHRTKTGSRRFAAIAGIAVGIAAATTYAEEVAARQSEQQIRAAMRTAASRPQHILVNLERPTSQSEREALGRAGLRLTGSLGGIRYIARPTAWIEVDRVMQSGLVRSIDPLLVCQKMHRDLVAGKIESWAIVETAEQVRRRLERAGDESAVIATEQVEPIVAVCVQFHSDIDLLGAGFEAVMRHGGEVVSLVDAVNTLVVHLPVSKINQLAADDRVLWIEPPLPALTNNNDSLRARLGVGAVNSSPYNLDGAGVQVMIYDVGTVWPHADFDTRLVLGDETDPHYHSTHVAGIVAGSGLESSGLYRGVAPGAGILSYGFEVAGDLQPGYLYTDPGDIQLDYEDAIDTNGADISNNSIGSGIEQNEYDCAWQGDYGVTSALLDSIVWGSLGDPFRMVWSAGNERRYETCNIEGYGDYYSIAPPSGAKNHISVGALNSNNDGVINTTSWGPMDDGRLKPDLSAPGCQTSVDFGVTSTDLFDGYSTHCGTSMASPAVCGVGALMIQQWRLSRPGEGDLRNGTLKAIMANTTVDIVTPGPDYQTGYGSVRAQPAVDTIIQQRVEEAAVGTGEVVAFAVVVPPGSTELRVTIAWDDYPALPLAGSALVNDLDLKIIGPDGSEEYFPWTLNPLQPTAAAVQTEVDRLNNIEQVFINAPLPGAYRIEVQGFNVAWGDEQVFGIASSAKLLQCTQAATLTLDADRYACVSEVDIALSDCDLDLSEHLFDESIVLVRSDSEPLGEYFTLVERGVSVGIFDASIPISNTDSEGVLLVSDGDAIVVEYIDADNGSGGFDVPVLATALVDCSPPVLVTTSAMDVQGRSAIIHIETDEPASVRVWYGTECGDLTSSVSDAAIDLFHNVLVDGIDEATTYFFGIEMTDQIGHTSFDNANGQCFSFETLDDPDYFTQFFAHGQDLEGKTITFSPGTNELDYYTACIGYLDGELPVDPNQGTVLDRMNANEAYYIQLPDGTSFALYGQEYDRLSVNSAGGVEFGTSGDFTDTPSLERHFRTPRVSVWWGDYASYTISDEPTRVSYKLLPDRFVASWVEHRQYDNEDLRNTFQVEIFVDGTIRMSWLRLDTEGTLVGLSMGGGLPEDFHESDLVSLPDCSPSPPIAHDVEVVIGAGNHVEIESYAEDDGYPSQQLVTLIESLPQFGTLDDPVGQSRIETVPYELAGDAVAYTPRGAFRGDDTFEYSVTDGGSSPEGGDSNHATMTIHVGGRLPVDEWLTEEQPGLQGVSNWVINEPGGQGSFGGDPLWAFYGRLVYLSEYGDYPNNLSPQRIRTPALDLTGYTDVILRFQEWLAIEGGASDNVSIEGTLNDQNWFPIWNYDGPSVSATEWSLREHDLSWFADNQSNVRVRWVMGPTNESVRYPGWSLDEIQILAVPPPGGCIADYNNDGRLDFFDVQEFLNAFSSELPTADYLPDGRFDFFDIQAFLNLYSTGC